MAIDPRFVVELKGKSYPIFAGVLDAATKAGLKSLTTTVIQLPTKENGGFAVVMARAEFEDGRIFEDVGDCSPATTSPHLAAAALRLASTRAKGRALRDSVNCGMTLLEELPDEEQAAPVGAHGRADGKAMVSGYVAQPAPLSENANQTIKHGPVCQVCGEALKPQVFRAAMDHFGKALCTEHGKAERDRLRAAAETAPAS